MLPNIKGLVKINSRDRVRRTLLNSRNPWSEYVKAFPLKDRREAVVNAVLEEKLTYDMKYGGAYGLDRFGREAMVLLRAKYRKQTFFRKLWAKGIFGMLRNAEKGLSAEEKEIKSRILTEMEKLEKGLPFPKDYLYVSFIGIRQETKEKEKTAALLNSVLEYSSQKNLPLVMCVTDTKEVPFFQQRGFQIIGITSSKEFEYIKIYLIKQ